MRPANRGASGTGASGGSSSGSSGGSELPAEITGHRPRSTAPQVDIIDLRDRTDGPRDVAATETSTQPGVITCEAGCDGPPGKIVYAALMVQPNVAPQQSSLIAASLTNAPDVPAQTSSNTSAVLCVAGCFDEPAWKDPRLKSRPQPPSEPSVVLASLSPPDAAVSLPLRPTVAKIKPSTAAKRAPAVRSAALAPRRQAAAPAVTFAKVEPAPVRTVHKRKTIKRFAVKAKRVVIHRSARHKIIRPAAKYPPRPLPQPVRTAEVTAAPKHEPLSPGAVSAAKVTLAESRKPDLATISAVELARRATRDPSLRQKLASSSGDWLNKGKRDAEPSTHVR